MAKDGNFLVYHYIAKNYNPKLCASQLWREKEVPQKKGREKKKNILLEEAIINSVFQDNYDAYLLLYLAVCSPQSTHTK